MILRLKFALTIAFLTAGSRLLAQTGLPTATQPLTDIVMAPGAATQTIDLRNHFNVSGVSGQVVQFTTVVGTFNVEMLPASAPTTVTNFLSYVNEGAYNNTIIHRSQKLNETAFSNGASQGTNHIIQGGGYTHALSPAPITQKPAINLEYNQANARGTIAMARTTEPNSATSEWFFNVDDNSTVLGQSNGGGYAVFGRVIGTGMSVVDAIAGVRLYAPTGALFDRLPLRNVVDGQTLVQLQNYVAITKVAAVPIYPPPAADGSVLNFTNGSSNSNPAAVNATITGSELSVTPVAGASGVATITIVASDAQGNPATSSFRVGVAATGAVALPPASQTPAIGGSATFSVTVAGGATAYQWLRNGVAIAGANASTYTISNVQPANAGLYAVTATTASGTVTSEPAILAPVTTQKVVGAGQEVDPNVKHPNGNFYDQLLLTGGAATFTADAGQVTRISYLDLNDDIVQVEFSGAGSVTLVLDAASGPAAPVNYNQAQTYMKGHGSIYIANAGADSHVSAFTVGKLTAYDPTGAYNIAQPVSPTNDPANNGNPIFKAGTNYDGMADIGVLAIVNSANRFGSVRTANANYMRTTGYTGVYAPGVRFGGPFFVHDLAASDQATPVLLTGTIDTGEARVTGGNLQQPNGRAVRIEGITKIVMAAGVTSHNGSLTAQANQGVIERNGQNVTSTVIVNP